MKTLPKRQIANGLSEALKMAMTFDKETVDLFRNEDPFEKVELLVQKSVEIKARVVEQDEKEAGLRRVLNFGHTLGHAFESFSLTTDSPLRHGEAVALGMWCALWLSVQQCGLDETILHDYERKLPMLLDEAKVTIKEHDIDAIMAFLTHDKKNFGEQIRFVLLEAVGKPLIDQQVPENLIRESAMDVNAPGKSLLAIINDILDISKIEAGKMEINCAEYEIVSLLEDVVNMTNIRAKKKKLEFIADIDSSLPVRMYGDDLRIKQIILNLLSNGVKYTNEGSVTLKIHGEKEEGGEYIILHISVCDTGIGIKPEEQDNLFKAFQRLDEATNRKVEGTGLGMSIANEMLRLMDSKIYFESEYGKGTNFYFDLRQKIIDSTEIGEFDMNAKNQEKVYLKNAGFTAPNSKILVVDDNSINRKVLIGFLRTVGCQVSEASSGFECLDIIKEEHFDLILLDHLMPELDGVGTLEKIKSEENKCMDTPVIICTANAVSGMKESFLATGFNGFISKPVDSKVLYKVLEQQLPKDQIVEGQVEIGVVSAEPEEELPDLDNFDFRYAKLCLGSVSVIKSVASDFYDQTFRIVDALEGYAADLDNTDNMSRYRTDVHALKSTSRMVGEINLSGLAKTSEFAAKESDKETVLKLHPMILKEIDVARADLEIMFPEKTKESENVTKEQIELSKLKELLDRLQNALDARNVKEQDAIALELSNYSYDAKLSDKIEELITNIKILKMIKASMTLAEIKKIVEEM